MLCGYGRNCIPFIPRLPRGDYIRIMGAAREFYAFISLLTNKSRKRAVYNSVIRLLVAAVVAVAAAAASGEKNQTVSIRKRTRTTTTTGRAVKTVSCTIAGSRERSL